MGLVSCWFDANKLTNKKTKTAAEITSLAHAETVWRKRSKNANCYRRDVPMDCYQYIINEILGNQTSKILKKKKNKTKQNKNAPAFSKGSIFVNDLRFSDG